MADMNASLLPAGLHDLLPPDARKEMQALMQLLSCFESFGYAQVTPPLLEFESSLLEGRGESLAQQTFRVMDPLSQQMMGFRPDMTLQIARIARSRLASYARPLRLCYAGRVLKIKPEPLQTERQLSEAGIEIIGADTSHADAEVMIVAAEALALLGVKDVSIDINLPGLLAELCPEVKDNASLKILVKEAISRKDIAKILALPIANNAILAALAEASGSFEKAMAALEQLQRPETSILTEIATRMEMQCPFVRLTLDPIEYRGFDYHQGVSFSIFAKGTRHEIGRGGRYQVDAQSATGFTLYVTHLLRLLPAPEAKKRLLLAREVTADVARRFRNEEWITVIALTDDLKKEAAQNSCTHILKKGTPEKI